MDKSPLEEFAAKLGEALWFTDPVEQWLKLNEVFGGNPYDAFREILTEQKVHMAAFLPPEMTNKEAGALLKLHPNSVSAARAKARRDAAKQCKEMTE